MIKVVECIYYLHDMRIVILAGLLCIIGSQVTAQAFRRAAESDGGQRDGWLFLTALSSGVVIWCTHFAAMLGYDPGLPIGIDAAPMIASMLIAVFCGTFGFYLATLGWGRFMPAIGGAVVGLSVASMHFTGMLAYRVQGVLSWDMNYLIASVIFAVGFGMAALHIGMRRKRHSVGLMGALIALAVLAEHFIGMTAFRVEPMLLEGTYSNPDALQALAVAVASVSFIVVGGSIVSFLIDDSARAAMMERLHGMAMTDVLTGLPNRAHFNERLGKDMAATSSGRLALVGIDLNRFKEINDGRGHNAGDVVLRTLGERMAKLVRPEAGEFIARTGGDEFAALCRIGDREDLSDFLERLKPALSQAIPFEGADIMPGGSLGVAIWPDDATNQESLLNHADFAMYRAKASGDNAVVFYEPAMSESHRTRQAMAADLRMALERGELCLHYQIHTAVSTGETLGYEALLRWQHPLLGIVGPADFISIAEEAGLMGAIGEWTLREACAEAVRWDAPHRIAVNLSATQFVHDDLASLIMQILLETGLEANRLELELTEAAMLADRERALHMLRRIKALGVRIALDDFGTGYSSLDMLRAFPFDRIKIDRAYCSSTNPQAIALVRAVMALGKTLNIPIAAEGIETADQLNMADSEGFSEAQGFLFGRPVPQAHIKTSPENDEISEDARLAS